MIKSQTPTHKLVLIQVRSLGSVNQNKTYFRMSIKNDRDRNGMHTRKLKKNNFHSCHKHIITGMANAHAKT